MQIQTFDNAQEHHIRCFGVSTKTSNPTLTDPLDGISINKETGHEDVKTFINKSFAIIPESLNDPSERSDGHFYGDSRDAIVQGYHNHSHGKIKDVIGPFYYKDKSGDYWYDFDITLNNSQSAAALVKYGEMSWIPYAVSPHFYWLDDERKHFEGLGVALVRRGAYGNNAVVSRLCNGTANQCEKHMHSAGAVYLRKSLIDPDFTPLQKQSIVEAARYSAYVKTSQGLEKEFDLQLANELRDGAPDDAITRNGISIGMVDGPYQYDSQALAEKVGNNVVDSYGLKGDAANTVFDSAHTAVPEFRERVRVGDYSGLESQHSSMKTGVTGIDLPLSPEAKQVLELKGELDQRSPTGGGECCIFNPAGGGGCGPCGKGSAGSILSKEVTNCTCCAKSDEKTAKMLTSLIQNETSINQSMMNPTTTTGTNTGTQTIPNFNEVTTNEVKESEVNVKKDITLTQEQYDELLKAKKEKNETLKRLEDLENEHKTNILNQIFSAETVKDENVRKALFDKYYAEKNVKLIKDLYADFNTHFVPSITEKVKAETKPPEEPEAEEEKTEEKAVKKSSAGSLKPEPKVEKTPEQQVFKKINEARMIHQNMFGDL